MKTIEVFLFSASIFVFCSTNGNVEALELLNGIGGGVGGLLDNVGTGVDVLLGGVGDSVGDLLDGTDGLLGDTGGLLLGDDALLSGVFNELGGVLGGTNGLLERLLNVYHSNPNYPIYLRHGAHRICSGIRTRGHRYYRVIQIRELRQQLAHRLALRHLSGRTSDLYRYYQSISNSYKISFYINIYKYEQMLNKNS